MVVGDNVMLLVFLFVGWCLKLFYRFVFIYMNDSVYCYYLLIFNYFLFVVFVGCKKVIFKNCEGFCNGFVKIC